MAGTTAGNPLDRLTEGPPSPLAAPPPLADIEAELQRTARRRLAPPPEPDIASRSNRSTRSQRRSVVGGFDSPEGFAFGSDVASNKS